MDFKFKKDEEPTDLEKLIKRLTDAIENMPPTSEGYANLVDQLVKLKKIQENESRRPLSKDAMLAAGVNLAGIVMILSFEHGHALTSKALGFVFKSKSTS